MPLIWMFRVRCNSSSDVGNFSCCVQYMSTPLLIICKSFNRWRSMTRARSAEGDPMVHKPKAAVAVTTAMSA